MLHFIRITAAHIISPYRYTEHCDIHFIYSDSCVKLFNKATIAFNMLIFLAVFVKFEWLVKEMSLLVTWYEQRRKWLIRVCTEEKTHFGGVSSDFIL